MGGSRRGDFSRVTFDPSKHYSGVLMQQGRVQLDSDWNEQSDIIAHRLRTQAVDFIGSTGAPSGSPGFKIAPRASLRFDGKSSYLSLGSAESAVYCSTPELTIEARIMARQGGAGGVVLCRYDRVEQGKPLQYSYMLSVLKDGRLRLDRAGSNRQLTSDRPLAFGRWSSIKLSHDRAAFHLSIDGHPAGDLDEGWGRNSLGAYFLVGLAHLEGDGPRGFDGSVREIRLTGGSPEANGGESLGLWSFEGGGSDVVLDRSGRGNHAILGGGKPEHRPLLDLDDIEINAGRYYAGGMLCENERTVELTGQPDLPGIELPTGRDAGRSYLFYLDVWERYVAPAREPALGEPALGGADTAGRTQIVAQTRWLPVENEDIPAGDNPGIAEWDRLLPARRVVGKLQARRAKESPGRLENRLYRVEIHSAGGLYGWPRVLNPGESPLEVESVLPAPADGNTTAGLPALILKEWPEGSNAPKPGEWVEVFSVQTDRSGKAGALVRVNAVDPPERKITLGDQIESLNEQHTNVRLRQLASFKWSRDNGSIAVPIEALEKGSRVVSLAPTARVEPGFSPGDWVEISDDHSDLDAPAAALSRVVGADPQSRSVTFDLPFAGVVGTDPDLHPVAVRWDGYAAIGETEWQSLEHGIKVRFGASETGPRGDAAGYRPGDHWVFAARTASGTIDWPAGSSGEPLAQAPMVDGHHFSPLAVLRFDEWGFELRDIRPVFQPLTTGAVSKAGDRMHGPLEIRPVGAGDPGGAASGGKPAPSLIVAGVAQADTLLGELGSPNAIRTFNLSDAAVTRSKISPDVGTVPAGFSILGASPDPPPGYAYTGCSLMIRNPNPHWELRAGLEIGEQSTELHSVAVGGRVYTFSDSGRTWCYDPYRSRLEERQRMPEPRGRFAAAAARGKIYLVGGVDYRGERVGSTLEYDPEADAWSWRQGMPTPRSDLALAEEGGKLYALGGLRDFFFLEVVSRRNEVYDPLADHWSRRRPLPSARYALSAAAAGRGVFAFGGRRRWFLRWLGQAVTAVNEEYLPGVDRWVRRPNLMPAPRSDGGTARLGDAIFVVGGRSLFGWSSDTSSFEHRADSWEPSAQLPAAAAAPGVAAVDGRLIVHSAGATHGTLEVQECRIASNFFVHSKSAAPEGDIEPQLRMPGEKLNGH